MVGTSMRVSEDTHKMVVKTRGILEQLFKRRLSLDDATYLSMKLISSIYETVQRLDAQQKITIVDLGVGIVELDGLENVADVLPEIIQEITEINCKLAEKEKKSSRLVVTRTGG